MEIMNHSVEFGFPSQYLWKFPQGNTPLAPAPFEKEWLVKFYEFCMKTSTPLTIAIVYFSFVHFVNPIIRKRQAKKAQLKGGNVKDLTKKEIKRLPAAPFSIATYKLFKLFVLLHNVFLCWYSVWTFVGMSRSIYQNIQTLKPLTNPSRFQQFFQSVCDLDFGVFSTKSAPLDSLLLYGFWFYVSKFYEVLDTIIILLKGRPSSLLQSYHHAGAMMCMWAGIRYRSPPIWIFVIFNSFIHSLMYFYFTLSCLKIRVPNVFKRALTSMQITQFVVGGSLAVVHAFIWYTDLSTGKITNCIGSSDQALPLIINVAYLTPLTALFAAFYIESYIKRAQK
mmetsp:Transcript_6771/g.8571  ORF Transcript_6771/g.8571 Transcript_6771/m.8571 type:complete len:336 (+) Transcript_6771:107-1114(+)